MKYINDIDIRNKRVLIRVDFNVPLENQSIKDFFRLQAADETINYCLSQNCSIVIMTHLGRPDGKYSEELSVYPIVEYLEEKYNTFVHFSEDCISDKSIKTSSEMIPKEIHLLENLRFHSEETQNDVNFAKKLSCHADIYINDAFGTAHRSHASNSSIITFFDIYALGCLFKRELRYLKSDDKLNKEGSTLIVGGAKVSSKMKMLTNFLDKSDNILIGGGMAYTFLKAKGHNIGKSLCEDDMIPFANTLLEMAESVNTNIILPVDNVCSKEINDSEDFRICYIDDINSKEIGLDIGPETCMIFENIISKSDKVLWNGPLGAFEFLNFSTGTQFIASHLKRITESKNISTIIGGGDTVSAIQTLGNLNGYTHISTGGGAALKLLSGEKLNVLKEMVKHEQY